MRGGIIATAFGVTLVAGCALFLDWDPEGLPCDDEKKCSEGYTCLVTQCIADNSLSERDTCTNDEQCRDDLVCGNTPFYCRQPCYDFFRRGACEIREFCRPEHREGDSVWKGTCFESECKSTSDCARLYRNQGRACVRITGSANACLFLCEPQVDPNTGVYSDNCGSTPSALKYCEVIGEDHVPVCLDQVGQPQGVNEICAPVASVSHNACARGLSCVPDLAVCSPYCNSTTDDCSTAPTDALLCCDYTTPANWNYGLCQSTCSPQ